jgi:pimeloyl-ACP methyl ester carboxylesterase
MYYEEYGKNNKHILLMLHGANFVHAFGRQYSLAGKYRIIVPHLMGFGKDASRIFNTNTAIAELAEFISNLGTKVTLVGFSLGAQLGFKLICEHPELFNVAIFVSPWLIKHPSLVSEIVDANLSQLSSMKNKWKCGLIGMMCGLPPKQTLEFVGHMQHVSPETIRNSVDNGISLDTVSGFEKIPFPVVALSGALEENVVKDSVKALAARNPNCRYEIWDKAAHNIPPLFHKQFNKLICELIDCL